MTPTVGNIGLQIEYYIGKRLHGHPITDEGLWLGSYLAKLPLVDLVLKELVESDTSELLDDDKLAKICSDPAEFISLLEKLRHEGELIIPELQRIIKQEQQAYYEQQINQYDSTSMNELVLLVQQGSPKLNQSNKFELLQMWLIFQEYAGSIIEILKHSIEYKFLKLSVPSKLKPFKIFCIDEMTILQDAPLPSEYLVKYYNVLNIFQTNLPPTAIDPFKLDAIECIIDLFKSPKNYFKNVKLDKVISSQVANEFRVGYPEYYKVFVNHFMDIRDNLSYQELRKFEIAASVPPGDGSLSALVTASFRGAPI